MNKRIAIISGASKGIGSAISQHLIEENCFVILVDVDSLNGEKLATQLKKENAKFIPCDIGNEKNVSFLFKSVISEYGKIDILINNAGIIRDNMIWKMPADDFDAVIHVNLKGSWLMCKEAAIIMREQKNGRIVNIASRAWLGNRGQSNYSASKAGIVGLTRVLALELGKYGIMVNAIAPGFIDTPLTQKLSADVREKLIQTQPLKIIGKPADIANAVVFLTAEKTQFITGQTIYIDGGKSIGAGV